MHVAESPLPSRQRNRRRKALAVMARLAMVPILAVLLFVLNGTLLCDGTKARAGTVEAVAVSPAVGQAGHIRVMAFNIAKGFVHLGGHRFAARATVETRLDEIAAIIRSAEPDIVCLSEVIRECGPCDLDQVGYLAEKSGLANWAFGECYSFGLPFYRIVGGNAVLSRYPIRTVANIDLVGRKPFHITKNNRRALVVAVGLPGGEQKVWSIHNDSFDPANNRNQVLQILSHPASQGAFIAGDFNARPEDASMDVIRRSGRFAAVFDGPFTFPANAPSRTIDYVLAPTTYQPLAHRVIPAQVSDHLAVVTTFGPGP